MKLFVETGTFHGKSCVWAANNFDSVLTFEKDKQLFDKFAEQAKKHSNLTSVYGDSAENLFKTLGQIESQTSLFWLDAHDVIADNNEERSSSPLIKELEFIARLEKPAFVLIDDARFILSKALAKETGSLYPEIGEIISAIDSGKHKYILFLCQDNLLFVAQELEDRIIEIIKPYSVQEELAAYISGKFLWLLRPSLVLRLRRAYKKIFF